MSRQAFVAVGSGAASGARLSRGPGVPMNPRFLSIPMGAPAARPIGALLLAALCLLTVQQLSK